MANPQSSDLRDINPYSNDPPETSLETLADVEAEVAWLKRGAVEAGQQPNPIWDRRLRAARIYHEQLLAQGDEPIWFELSPWAWEYAKEKGA